MSKQHDQGSNAPSQPEQKKHAKPDQRDQHKPQQAPDKKA